MILALERSTATQSAALVPDVGAVEQRVFPGSDSRSADWPAKVRDFVRSAAGGWEAIDRIVVGCGPGSFTGIRAALAFARGLAAGRPSLAVCGLPSTWAFATAGRKLAVVGDARRGLLWLALHDGLSPLGGFSLVAREGLGAAIPEEYAVVTPDGERIGGLLAALFGARAEGAVTPLAGRLGEVARACPRACSENPLPVYLQPAVR